jgi:broad specificity phosphatase PhoE
VQIFLVRHGRPTVLDTSPISGFELGRWVAQYNECGVDRAYPPPEAASRVVASAEIVVASNLRRSVESAEWLAPSADVEIDPELREAVLPDSVGISLRLPPGAWVVLARVAWWLNWCQSVEAVKSTRQRAERVADRLCALAKDHRCVAVVGHGVFNWFIAAQLARRSWRGPRRLPSGHWAVAEFVPR